MDVRNIRKWCREFTAGRTEIHDEERSGRPSISDEIVAKVEQIMRQDRRTTLDYFCILVPEVSRNTIGRALKSWNIGRCAQDGSHACSQKTTEGNALTHHANFFSATQTKMTTFWIRLSRVMKPGHTTSHLRPNNNHVSGGIPLRPSHENSKQHSLPAK